MRLFKVIVLINILFFVSLFDTGLALDQVCGKGCICEQVNESFECRLCIDGFQFNPVLQSCSDQLCDEGLLGYYNQQNNPPIMECLAICPKSYKPNIQLKVCEVSQECSQTYNRKPSITNLKTAVGFGIYSEKYIIVLYDTFMNIISIMSGNFEKQINYPSDVIIIKIIEGQIFMIQGNKISLWDFERNEINQIGLISQGQANKNSYLIKLSDNTLIYTTIDTDQQKLYINAINSNQIIISKPIELDTYQKEIKINNDNILIKLTQQYKLQLSVISIQNQQIQLQSNQVEDFVCFRDNGEQINLLGSLDLLIKVASDQYIATFTLENSIFILKQTQNKCTIAIKNVKPLKVMVITKQIQPNTQIFLVQLQNQIQVYSQDFQLIQQIPTASNLNDINIYQFLSNGKIQLKLFALQTKGKLDILECQFENSINFIQTQSLQLKIYEPLKLFIFNSTKDNLTNKKLPVLYAINYYFTSINIQTNTINYNVADLETNYSPHKSAITSLQLTKDLNILVTSSVDGVIVIWNLQNKHNAVVYYIFNEIQETCSQTQIFQNRYIFAKYVSKIIIIDIYDPTTFIQIPIKNTSTSVLIQDADNYLIINADGCLQFYYTDNKLIFQSCDNLYNSLSNIVTQKNNQFVIRNLNLIQILQTDIENKKITVLFEYSHNSKIVLFKVRTYQGPKLFSIIIVDGSLQFYCFNNQLKQQIKLQLISSISSTVDFNFPVNSDQEDYFLIAVTSDASQSLKYQVYQLSDSLQQPKLINSLQYLTNIYSIFVDKQSDGEDIFRIPLLMPFSVVSLIYQFSYSQNSGRIESGVHPLLSEEFIQKCTVKFNQDQWIGICGSSSGYVGFAQVLKQNYYQVYKGNQQTSVPISSIRQSLALERYFIMKGSVLVYNFHTDELEEEIIFQDTKNPIKEIQFNENLKIITFIKDNEIFIRNYQNNNHLNNKDGLISGVLLDDIYKRIIVYGNNLNIYLPSQQNQQQQILTSSIAVKCILTKTLVMCKFNPQIIIFYDRKILSQGITIIVNNFSTVNFNFVFDETYNLLFVYYNQVLVYDLRGQLIKILQQPQQVLIEFNFYGDKIVLSDPIQIFIYERQTQNFILSMKSDSAGTIKKTFYLPSQNILCYYTDAVRAGQVLFFSLTQLRSLGQYTNQIHKNFGDMFSIVNDELNTILNSIDVLGNINQISYKTSFTVDNSLQLQHLFTSNQPAVHSLEFNTNTILLGNQQSLYRLNYNSFLQTIYRYHQREVQFSAHIKIEGINYFLFLDKQNVLYQYSNYENIYLTEYQEQTYDIFSLPLNSYFVVVFKNKLILYQALKQNTQDKITISQVNIISGYLYRSRVCNQIFLTYDQRIVDYDFISGVEKGSVSLQSQSDLITQKICANDLNSIIFGFNSGKIIIYDRQKYSIRQVNDSLFTNQPIRNIMYTTSTITLCQQNGDFIIISLQNFEMKRIQKSDYLKIQIKNYLSHTIFDSVYSRYYIWFQNQKRMMVLDDKFILIKYISFPHDEYNSVYLGKDISILYCPFQLNIYNRQTLQFIFSIRRMSRFYNIKDISLLNEKYLILVFINRIELYLINTIQQPYYKLIDSIDALHSNQILLQFLYDSQTQKEIFLEFIGYSMNSIFEKRISVNLLQSNQNYCVSSIVASNKLQVEQQFNAIYSSTSNLNFIINFEIDQEIEVISQIGNNNVDYIFTSKQNQLEQNVSKLLIFRLNTFNLIKKPLRLKNFDLKFFSEGDYVINQESQIAVLQDIIIKDQDLINIKLKFTSMKSVTLHKIKFQQLILSDDHNHSSKRNLDDNSNQYYRVLNIKGELQPLIEIDDTEQIIIIDLIIESINFHEPHLLFKITNSESVFIKNCIISKSSFGSLFYFQNINNIKIQNLIIKENNSITNIENQSINKYAFIILGSQLIKFYNVTIKDNHDIFFIYTSKIQQQSNKIITLTDDELQIQSIKLQNNFFNKTFSDLQSMIQISNSQIDIDDLLQENNLSNIQIQSCNSIKISSSQFLSNSAQNGGALNLMYISETFIIKNCKFNFNRANSSGGAIYLYEVVQLQIDDQTEIISNFALIGGGIRYVVDKTLTLLQISPKANIIKNNAEIFGPNIVGIPTKIELNLKMQDNNQSFYSDLNQQTGKLSKIQMTNFQSGGYLSITLKFIDDEGNSMNIKKSKIENDIYPSDIITELQNYSFQLFPINRDFTLLSEESIVNSNQYDENEKGIVKKDLQVSANLNSKQSIQLKIQNKDKNNVYNIEIEIEYRSCQQGEILKRINDHICNCYSCPNGFYSITNYGDINGQNQKQFESIQYKKCPDSAVDCVKSSIYLKNGFWRKNNDTDEILPCHNNENNCIPEDIMSRNGCLEGHVGPLCEQCDYEGKVWDYQYTNSIGFLKCSQCAKNAVQITYILIISILLLIYLFVQLLLFMNGFVHTQTCFYLRRLGILPISASSVRGQSNFYMKILMNYFQISAIALNFKIKLLPNFLVFGTNIFGNTVGSIAVDVNCLYSQYYQDSLGQGRLRQITQTMISPIFFIILFLILEILQRQKLYQVKDYHKYTLSCFLFLFFQPGSLTLYSKSLTCRQIGSITVYSQDMNYNCDDQEFGLFVKIFTLPNLIIWIILPLIPLYQIFKVKKRLSCCRVRYKFGYFYSEFKEEYFYWEFIRIYLRSLIVLLFTFLQQSINVAVILTNLAIFFYIYSIVKVKPFSSFKIQKYEKFSYFTLIILMALNALNKTYNNSAIEIFYTLINYFFIILTTITIFQEKINNKNNLIGKCFFYFLIKFIPKKYSYMFQTKQTNLPTYLKWIKIKRNLNQLHQLKSVSYNEYSTKKLKKQNFLVQFPQSNNTSQTMAPNLLNTPDAYKFQCNDQYSDINSPPVQKQPAKKLFAYNEDIQKDEVDELQNSNDNNIVSQKRLNSNKLYKFENNVDSIIHNIAENAADNIDEPQQYEEENQTKTMLENRRISSMNFKLEMFQQSHQKLFNKY